MALKLRTGESMGYEILRIVAGGNNCNYEDEECDRWKREYERVNNSYSYRLGLACTYIPRRVIKTLRKIKRKLVLFIRG